MTKSAEERYKYELEIIQKLGKIPSCREMQKEIEATYGKHYSQSTINEDLKKDLETLTEKEYTNQKNNILTMLDTEIDIAHKIAIEDSEDSKIRLKAMDTVSKLSRVKTDILNAFKKAQAEINKEEKPVYNISIGKPEKVEDKKNAMQKLSI